MAKSSTSVENLIKTTFALQVAVRCSEDAEKMCRKNQLTFSEMLKPFCALSNNVQLKDVQSHLYNLRNVRVRFSELTAEPVPDSKLRILLGEAVHETTSHRDNRRGGVVHIGNVSTMAATPWFDAYRDTYLDFLKQSEHETIKHYISVIMVMSSTSKDPMKDISQLYTSQKQSELSKHPKWLSPHIYYYHVLLHDAVEGAAEMKRAQENYVLLKTKYGESSCCMLQVNSCTTSSPSAEPKMGPDVWSRHMKTGEQEETDSGFKRFHFKKRASKSKANGPILNNAHPRGSLKLSGDAVVIKPENEKEETHQLNASSSDPSNSDLNQSSAVKPGDDPLSQLTTLSPPGKSNARTSNSITDKNYLNDDDDLLNSVESPVVRYGQCLSEHDHRNLGNFVVEFVGKRLLPHFSEVLKNLNEWLLSRKSARRSFSNMVKGFSKVFAAPNNVIAEDPNYAYNSLEMQLRQFADIAFLLQCYDQAFQCYHQVKKEFQSANAWIYYGGVLEMCAMSAYLLSSTRRDVVSYLEEAISVYNLSCKAPYYSVRASLLLIDILKERGQYNDLTQLCIRMTSEDAELRSAVCVEQASHAFLRAQPSRPRKYALHLILAGNRYARAAQRLHSLHSYLQALDVYKGKGWTQAEDYVHFCLANHSFSLHQLSEAKMAFEKLLSHESVQSPAQQQLHLQDYIYVHKQLLSAEDLSHSPPVQITLTTPTTSQSHVGGVRDVPILPIPFIKPQKTKVTFITAASRPSLTQPLSVDVDLFSKPRSSSYKDADPVQSTTSSSVLDGLRIETMLSRSRSSSTNTTVETIGQHLDHLENSHQTLFKNYVAGRRDYDPREEDVGVANWEELEKQAAVGLRGTLHENFVQSVQVLDESTDNQQMPFTVINESVAVGLVLKNPLGGVPLLMTNLCLIWEATPTRSHTPSSPPVPAAVCEVVNRVLLQPEEEKMVTLHITPLKEGELVVNGFLYNLCVELGQSSPLLNSGGSKANALSLSLNSRDTLYQIHQGSHFQPLLSEGVQGRVEFDVRGLRLNNSKSEKASLVYSKDYRLHWRVTAPMPKIVTAISSLPRSILTGEITRVGVEVFNVGQVALNSLRITSTLGSNLLLDKQLSSGPGHPVYSSTLLSPINRSPAPHSLTSTSSLTFGTFSPHCLELPLPQGRLEPGKGIRANLILQGTSSSSLLGTDAVPWNVVFYYEPALISANSRLSHRVLRHSCLLHIRESLQLRATAVHGQLPTSPSSSSSSSLNDIERIDSRFDINRLVITLEAENKCQLTSSSAIEMRVSQLSCASTKWTVCRLDRQQGLLCLLPSENGVVHLRGSLLRHPSPSGLVYTDVPLGPTIIPSESFPVKELFNGSREFSMDGYTAAAYLPSEGMGARRREGKTDSKEREEIFLIVFWQALVPTGSDTLFSYGHHTISVHLPQSMSAIRESSHPPPSPYDLVKFYLEHPTTYHHSGFVKSDSVTLLESGNCTTTTSLCRVPVKVILQNCYHKLLKVMVELVQPKEGSHGDSKRHLENSLFWSGGCKRQLNLDPNSTKMFSVFANFCWPGVYNLNTLKISVAKANSGQYHTQRWQRTSYITIE